MTDKTTDGDAPADGGQPRPGVVRSYLQRQQRDREREAEARRQQSAEHVHYLAAMSDDDLIGSATGFPAPHNELEMSRRLKDAVRELTAELPAFRKSSEAAAAHQETAGRRTVWLTVAIVACTVALLVVGVLQTLIAVRGGSPGAAGRRYWVGWPCPPGGVVRVINVQRS